jgi:hypothetical protein
MQLQTVRAAVIQEMGISSTDTAITTAVLDKLVYAAQRKIDLIHDWPWLHKTDATWTATVADQAIYTAASDLASDWRKTLFIVIDGDNMLVPKQKQEIKRYANQTGQPRFFAAEGNEIVLAPTPDAVYTIEHEYIHVPTEVTSGTAHLISYDWAIDLLIAQTCIMVARRLRDPEMAGMFQRSYDDILETLHDEVRRTRQLPTPRHRADIGWS